MWTTSHNLLAGQERYKRDFDNRVRYPTPEYQVGDQVLVNYEAALRSEEKSDKDRVNNKLAPRTEGPFLVVQVEDYTLTVLRGTRLKDQLFRDRVVKSSPLRSNEEDTQPDPAVSDWGDRNLPGAPPSEGTCSAVHCAYTCSDTCGRAGVV